MTGSEDENIGAPIELASGIDVHKAVGCLLQVDNAAGLLEAAGIKELAAKAREVYLWQFWLEGKLVAYQRPGGQPSLTEAGWKAFGL